MQEEQRIRRAKRAEADKNLNCCQICFNSMKCSLFELLSYLVIFGSTAYFIYDVSTASDSSTPTLDGYYWFANVWLIMTYYPIFHAIFGVLALKYFSKTLFFWICFIVIFVLPLGLIGVGFILFPINLNIVCGALAFSWLKWSSMLVLRNVVKKGINEICAHLCISVSCSCFWLLLVALTIVDLMAHDFVMESHDWQDRIQIMIFPGGVFLAAFWVVLHFVFLTPRKKTSKVQDLNSSISQQPDPTYSRQLHPISEEDVNPALQRSADILQEDQETIDKQAINELRNISDNSPRPRSRESNESDKSEDAIQQQSKRRKSFFMNIKSASELNEVETAAFFSNPRAFFNRCKSWHSKSGHLVYGGILGLALVSTQIIVGLVLNFTLFSSSKTSDSSLLSKQRITAVGVLLVLPLSLGVGIMMAGSKMPRSQRYFLYVILISIPAIVMTRFLNSSVLGSSSSSLNHYSWYLAVGTPGMAAFWITMFCLQKKYPYFYLFSLVVYFLFFIIPLLAIYPLITIELGDYSSSGQVICLILASSGILLFILGSLFQFTKPKCSSCSCKCRCKKCPKSNLSRFFTLAYDFRNFGFWINSFSLLITCSVYVYVWTQFSFSDSDTVFAFMISMPTTLLFLFISNNYILGLSVHQPPGNQNTNVLDYLFGSVLRQLADFDKEQIALQQKKESRCQGAISGFGIFVPPAVALPVYFFAVSDYDRKYSLTVFLVMVALIAWAILTIGLLELKKRCGPYARTGLPIFIGGEWGLILLPFCVGLPSAVVYAGSDSNLRERVISSAIGYLIAMLVVIATLLSFALNHVFKRLEYEKRARYCVTELKRELREKAVRSQNTVLRVLFDNFQLFGRQELHERLKKRMLAYYWEVSDKDPDPRFSKILVQRKTFQELQKRSQREKEKADYSEVVMEKKRKDKKEAEERRREKEELRARRKPCLRRYCACCYQDDGNDEQAMQGEEELEEQKELNNAKERELKQLAEEERKRRMSLGGAMLEEVEHLTKEIDFKNLVQSMQRSNGNSSREGEFVRMPRTANSENKQEIEELINLITTNNDLDAVKQLLSLSEIAAQFFIKKVFQHYASGDPTPAYPAPYMTVFDLTSLYILVERPRDVDGADLQINIRYMAILRDEQSQKFGEEHFIRFLREQAYRTYRAGTPEDEEIAFKRYIVEKLYSKIIIHHANFSKPAFNAKMCESALPTARVKTKISKKYLNPKQLFSHLDNPSPRNENNNGLPNQLLEQYDFSKLGTQSLHQSIEEDTDSDEQEDEVESEEKKKEREEKEKQRRWLRYSAGRRCCIKCGKCWGIMLAGPRRCCNLFCTKLGNCCSLGGKEAEIEDEVQDEKYYKFKKHKRKIMHLPSPGWGEISTLCVMSIEQSLEDYNTRQLGNNVGKYVCNFANVTMLLIKIFEFISLVLFCFSKDIGWNFSPAVQTVVVSANLQTSSSYNTFIYFFWTSVFLAFIYILLLPRSAKRARKGVLGMDKEGRPAKFCSCEFFLSRGTILLGASAYIGIMKNMFDSLACDFDTDTLSRTSDISCFTGTHFLYIAVSIFVLVVYYPLATFMYANLQFVNKGSDLKYAPNFIVYLAQVKLILAILASFFRRDDSIELTVRLVISAASILFLAYLSYRHQPCIIAKANIWHTMSYLICAWIVLSTLIVVLGKDSVQFASIFAVCSMFVGSLALFLITFGIYRVKYVNPSKAEKKLKTTGLMNVFKGMNNSVDDLEEPPPVVVKRGPTRFRETPDQRASRQAQSEVGDVFGG